MFVPANLPTPSVAPGPARPAAIPVVVLGADAVLAALPATAVQLAHACLAAGYQSAVPASWGEELIAHACLTQLAQRPPGPAICASCPRVLERLQRSGADLDRFVVRLASPPVATARYLRTLAEGTPLHITFVGGCPGAADGEVDEHRTPAEFLASLATQGIVPGEQPTAFDGVLPPDRRRHFSLPGGAPAPDALWEAGGGRRLVEIEGEDYATDVAEYLLAGELVLLDLAPGLGCACSGAASGVAPRNARSVVASLEPPRAPGPVVDVQHSAVLTAAGPSAPGASSVPPAPPPTRPAPPAPARPPVARPSGGVPYRAAPAVPSTTSRATPVRTPSLTPASGMPRRTPTSLSRLTTGGVPLARRPDGRLLPRAYMARSRSLPHLPIVPEDATAPAPADALPFDLHAPAAVATPPEGTPEVGADYASFGAGVAAAAPPVEEWRVRLDESIRLWRSRGFRTGVLERARALPHRPDVDGLLTTYAAAAEHLRRLEAAAVGVHPHVRGHALFRDPERVAAAEAFVGRLMGGE